jgi:hypothetical protein
MNLSRNKRLSLGGRLVLFVMAAACFFAASVALGQSPGGMGNHMGGHRHPGDRDKPPAKKEDKKAENLPKNAVVLTRHGGTYLRTGGNFFEVVWLPNQTRIYNYDAQMNPRSAREIRAQMSFNLSDRKEPVRGVFQYAPEPPGSIEQDFLVVGFDTRLLNDKDSPITIEFFDLSVPPKLIATFTPMVVKSDVRPYVAQVTPTSEDEQAVNSRQICPACGSRLGSQGPICKVFVGDYPLLLCKKDCIATVNAVPEKFLPTQPPAQGR